MTSMTATPAECLTDEQSQLAEMHMSLVPTVARGWMSRCRGSIERADLEQAGMLGLLDAARRFNPSRDVSFTAFASLRIRGAICDFLRAHDPLTRKRRRAVRELDGTMRALEAGLGRQPSLDEITARLGWDDQRMGEAREDASALRQGWAQVQDARPEHVNALPCTRLDPHAELAAGELRAELIRLIDALPEREKILLSLYYVEEMPLKDVAEILGVSQSRASQLHSSALQRLRKVMTASMQCA